MWKSALLGITLANLDTLNYFQNHKKENFEKDIFIFVKKGIRGLPFFFSFPFMVYASLLSLFSLLTMGKMPHRLNPKGRKKFMRLVSIIPFFGVLNKLVRAMLFLRMFDLIEVKGGNSAK